MKFKCENCRKRMDYDTLILEHGYGSDYDGETWYFCSTQCLLIYVIKTIKKEV